jgi:PAS domain S-box-containing protein
MKPKAKRRSSAKKAMSYRQLYHKYRLISDLIDHIPDVIYFKDRRGRLILVNQAHAKGLGLKPEDIIGKTDYDLFPPQRAAAMAKDDEYVMRSGKPILDKIERATRPDRVDNYVTTTKIPRFGKNGEIVGVMGITRDITHRMQVERLTLEKERTEKKLALLKEINRMRSELVAVLSHELRTPLAITKEAVSQVLDHSQGQVNSRQKKILGIAKDNLERLRHMIENLLDMSRIEKHRLRLHYSLVNLNDLFLSTSGFFGKIAHEKKIRLKYLLPKEQINIFVDAERINQTVSNLINNAIKFTEQNGEITVEARLLETKIRVGVIDSGIGIDRHDLPKLFIRFTQVSTMADAAEKGLGLGLSIAKELVEKHGGEIWAESLPGVGSKFYFSLPRFCTIKVLDKRTRDRINALLSMSLTVYLINVSFINFARFKETLKIRHKKLCTDLNRIMDLSLKEVAWPDARKAPVVIPDFKNGIYTVLCPEIKGGEANKLCEAIKGKLKSYFEKNKIENVFINVGVLSYPHEELAAESMQVVANISVKKLFIGSEIRRFRRIDYRAKVHILHAEKPGEFSQTIDIAKAGICFISKTPIETDAEIKIGLEIEKNKKPVYLTGRVAWRKNIEEKIKAGREKYKIGLEFTSSKEERKKLYKLVDSLASDFRKSRH